MERGHFFFLFRFFSFFHFGFLALLLSPFFPDCSSSSFFYAFALLPSGDLFNNLFSAALRDARLRERKADGGPGRGWVGLGWVMIGRCGAERRKRGVL
jgi:hypothetical protein